MTAGPVTIEGPAGWDEGDAPKVPGLELKPAAALTGDGGAMLAGVTDASGATLLPFDLLRSLEGGAVRADRVRLGDAAAYRYRDLTLRGSDDPVTALVVPTAAGVATVACTGEQAARRSCEAAAADLGLSAKPLSARPERRLREAPAGGPGNAAIAAGPGPREMAACAHAIGSRRRGRRSRVRVQGRRQGCGLPAGDSARARGQAALRRSLLTTASAYGRVAAAARTGKAKAYGKGRTDVRAGEKAVDAALERYVGLGYRMR